MGRDKPGHDDARGMELTQNACRKRSMMTDKAATRSLESLWAAIGQLLGCFAPDECARYLAHAGYG